MASIRRSEIYQACALQYTTVGLGITWGWTARRSSSPIPSIWIAANAPGLILLVRAWYQARFREGWSFEILACLTGYAVFVLMADPFINVRNEASALVGEAAILPFILSVRYLVRDRDWWAVIGIVLFTAGCVASLVFNAAGWRGGGTGFFSFWNVYSI